MPLRVSCYTAAGCVLHRCGLAAAATLKHRFAEGDSCVMEDFRWGGYLIQKMWTIAFVIGMDSSTNVEPSSAHRRLHKSAKRRLKVAAAASPQRTQGSPLKSLQFPRVSCYTDAGFVIHRCGLAAAATLKHRFAEGDSCVIEDCGRSGFLISEMWTIAFVIGMDCSPNVEPSSAHRRHHKSAKRRLKVAAAVSPQRTQGSPLKSLQFPRVSCYTAAGFVIHRCGLAAAATLKHRFAEGDSCVIEDCGRSGFLISEMWTIAFVIGMDCPPNVEPSSAHRRHHKSAKRRLKGSCGRQPVAFYRIPHKNPPTPAAFPHPPRPCRRQCPR